MLTEKCKEDFENWYIPWLRKQRPDYDRFSDERLLRKFYRMCFSMQYGVYVDFFDSVGITIEMFKNQQGAFRMYLKHNGKVVYNPMTEQNEGRTLLTRHEAQTKAIEKANEIYNNQNKIK